MVAKLPRGWSEKAKRLRATYEFKDFARAMVFLQDVAFEAESQEHHPDFSVHWNRIDFTVWSHDAGKVTERDRKLVAKLAKIATRHNAKVAKA